MTATSFTLLPCFKPFKWTSHVFYRARIKSDKRGLGVSLLRFRPVFRPRRQFRGRLPRRIGSLSWRTILSRFIAVMRLGQVDSRDGGQE